MQELIKVTTNEQGSTVVSARELYSYLEVKNHFTQWFNDNKEWFTEGTDYQSFKVNINAGHTTSLKTDYVITLDMAKELAMISKVEKGKQARQYFIECEKQLRTLATPKELSRKDLALLIVEAEEEKEKLLLENAKLAPKAEYADKVLKSVDVITTTTIAKELGMSATKLNRVLCDKKVQYKIDGNYVLYAKYQDKGYTKIKTHQYFGTKDGQAHTSHSLVWTEYGRAFIHMLINNRLSFHLQPDVKYQLTP